jgi:uncharacterized membrane protein
MAAQLKAAVVAFFGIMFALLFSTTAHAGFILCNNTGVPVTATVGWFENDAWSSRGWFNINPRECALTISGALTDRFIYYYAEGAGLKWQGSGEGSAFFCANHTSQFYYSLKENPSCDGYTFIRVDTGDSQQFTQNLTESTTDPASAAVNCESKIAEGRDAFIACWTRQVATEKQRQILDCVQSTSTSASLAVCASKGYVDNRITDAADCALRYSQNQGTAEFAKCLSNGYIDGKTEQVLNCAIDNHGSYAAMASCAAGAQLSPEQRRIYDCIAQNYQDYRAAGIYWELRAVRCMCCWK